MSTSTLKRAALRTLLLLACGLAWAPAPARAADDLRIGEWLGHPGVRLIAVEFYATWCKPCMAAMPRWKALQAKYRSQGLRVVMVNTQDPDGGCRSVGFVPDESVCDLRGRLSERFGLMGKLPAAFLWSWQGNLLVKKGHIDEVERAVATYLRGAPRVIIDAGAGVSPVLTAAVSERLTDGGKVLVLAGKDMVAALKAARKQTQGLQFDAKLQCKVGEEVPPNALLKVAWVGKGKQAFLNLGLHDLRSGCLLQSASAPWDASPQRLAREVVARLLSKLKRSHVQMPGTAAAFAPVGPSGPRVSGGAVDSGGRDSGPAVAGGEVAAAVGRLIVTVAPKDATVEVSGPGGFHDTRRGGWESASLAPGSYKVTATAAGHEAKTENVAVLVDDVQMTKLSLQRLGALVVQGTPAGAKVAIIGPGSFKGTGGLPVRVSDAATGEYAIEVSKAGFESERYAATVQLGATATVEVVLKAPGSLMVEGTPTGALVQITGPDGFSVKRGLPVTVKRAARGAYRVVVSRPGYEGAEHEVAVSPGETATVKVALAREGAVAAPAVAVGGASAAGSAAAGGYVRIAPGTFMMGSPSSEAGRDSDETQHKVRITRAFLLKATEVTQAEWRSVMGSNPSHFSSCGDRCPVEKVNWHEAVAYCNKLSAAAGLQACYAGHRFVGLGCTGYRLPTEAEWEYAARAGTTGARYGEVDAVAWYDGNSGSRTHEVGTRKPNAWGLFDMLGNVWEWTNDWKEGYSGAVVDPVGASWGQYRVFRGGSWGFEARFARAAVRCGLDPGRRYGFLGFRVARSPSP